MKLSGVCSFKTGTVNVVIWNWKQFEWRLRRVRVCGAHDRICVENTRKLIEAKSREIFETDWNVVFYSFSRLLKHCNQAFELKF